MLRSRSLNMMPGQPPILCDIAHIGELACFVGARDERVERDVRLGV
jgi:hypothetical protein